MSVILAALIALAQTQAAPRSVPGAVIAGRVVDADSNQPVTGAIVTLVSRGASGAAAAPAGAV
jgi:hypothetical protein